jgi:transcriptional regulator with XRE-family HTH domain
MSARTQSLKTPAGEELSAEATPSAPLADFLEPETGLQTAEADAPPAEPAPRPWFCEWVRTARGDRSLREFSDITGCAVGQLSQFETGKSTNPEWATIVRIAEHSQGRCLVPKLEVNMVHSDPGVALQTLAAQWRTNSQDPHNINLAVSLALLEVARNIGASKANAEQGEPLRSSLDKIQAHGDSGTRSTADTLEFWRTRRAARTRQLRLRAIAPVS